MTPNKKQLMEQLRKDGLKAPAVKQEIGAVKQIDQNMKKTDIVKL